MIIKDPVTAKTLVSLGYTISCQPWLHYLNSNTSINISHLRCGGFFSNH